MVSLEKATWMANHGPLVRDKKLGQAKVVPARRMVTKKGNLTTVKQVKERVMNPPMGGERGRLYGMAVKRARDRPTTTRIKMEGRYETPEGWLRYLKREMIKKGRKPLGWY